MILAQEFQQRDSASIQTIDLFYIRSPEHLFCALKIAVNTRLLLHNRLEGIGWFTFETLSRIAAAHPEHEFIYLFDRPFHASFITSENIQPVVIPPPARHPLLWKIWFNYAVPFAAKKHKAELFLSPDGFLSHNLAIPQIAVIHDLNFEHYPRDLKPSHSKYYRSQFPLFAKKASRIATVSEFSKNDISRQYGIEESNIDVVYNGVNQQYTPAAASEVNEFKQRHTNGADYFLFIGAMHPRKNISRLLKAFDLVKSQHGGNYKLVLAGNKYWWNEEIKSHYESMAHRRDVTFTGRLSNKDLNAALSGAIALTFVPYFEGFGIPVLEGFSTDCPVITSNITAMPEVAGDAALLTDPFSESAISKAMLLLLTHPEKRTELIEKGRKRTTQFSWEKTAALLWNTVEKTIDAT